MTRLLVTGASGLLGSNLVLEAGDRLDITAVVYQNPVEFETASVVQADLTDDGVAQSLVRDCAPDWVVHCAADTAIEALEGDPRRADILNVRMARSLARASKGQRAQFLYVSTDSVFDGRDGPYSEEDQVAPQNVYARSKLEGETAVTEEHPSALVIRTNIFGWSPGTGTSLAEWYHSRLKAGQECPGFTDIHFSPLYSRNLAHVLLRMLDEGLQGHFHVPGAECISKFEFGLQLAHVFEFDPDLVIPSDSSQMNWLATRPKNTCLDGSKLKKHLVIRLPSIHDGLVDFREDRERYFRQIQRTVEGEA